MFAAAVKLKQIGMNISFHELQMYSCLPKMPGREFASGQRFILFFGVSKKTVCTFGQRARYSNNIPKLIRFGNERIHVAGMKRGRILFFQGYFIAP